MAAPKTAGEKPKSKAPKGSKAACEAAGWRFAPVASIGHTPTTINGRTIHRRYRHEGGRGTMAIPPSGSGIEPRLFGGSLRAVAWAVEQLGQVARQPDEAPAGIEGVRLMLAAALASGEICGGPDEAPERPDGRLLSICRDALLSASHVDRLRKSREYLGRIDGPRQRAFSAAIDVTHESLAELPSLHATTREGLLQKARATLLVLNMPNLPSGTKNASVQTLIEDLIHLVPTLLDDRGRPASTDAGEAR